MAQRARDMKVFQNDDCTYTATIGHSLHYRDARGNWQDVDLSFHSDGHGGSVEDHSDVTVKVAGATVEATERSSGKGIRWITPAAPAVSGQKATVSDQGLSWTYVTSKKGLKLDAEVKASRGPKTYQFPYQVVGGAANLSVDPRGNLTSDVFFIPRPVVIGADLHEYDAGAWSLPQPHKAAFSFDDSSLPASAYPYVLDPTTTFTLGSRGEGQSTMAQSGDDGMVTSEDSTYPPAVTWAQPDDYDPFIVVQRSTTFPPSHFGVPNYAIGNGLLRWDTSALEGDRIEAAELVFSTTVGPIDGRGGSTNAPCISQNTDGRALVGAWYDFGGAIDEADYSTNADNDAFAGVYLSQFNQNLAGVYRLPFDSTDGIDTSGTTGLRLSISGGVPTGQNSLCMATLRRSDASRAGAFHQLRHPPEHREPHGNRDADPLWRGVPARHRAVRWGHVPLHGDVERLCPDYRGTPRLQGLDPAPTGLQLVHGRRDLD